MDIFTALHTRRSIRKYTADPVSDDDVRRLLDAAMIAPSAGNARPWQFIVVDDPDLLQRVPEINPFAAMAPRSPVSIVVCGDTAAEKYPGFWVQDCSAAVQNLLLAATGLGLGAVWTGIYPMEERVRGFRELLRMPDHVVPLALVVLGHHAGNPERQSRFDAGKVHRNRFGSSYAENAG